MADRIFAVPRGLALSARQGQAPPNAPDEPVLDMNDIQGNSLVGFNKDHQAFLFLRFGPAEKARQWVKQLAPRVATAEELLGDRRLFRELRGRRGRDAGNVLFTWMNVAFSYGGISKLAGPQAAEQFSSEAFKKGSAVRAARLGDRIDPAGAPVGWLFGSGDREPDALLTVASDSAALLAEKVAQLRLEAEQAGIQVVFQQLGATLPGALRGHEHFGFRDGISQPGVRGRASEGSRDFLTPRVLAPDDPLAQTFARPGQPLIWPGQFILGEKYPLQDPSDPVKPRPGAAPSPKWAANGSFVVVRRLNQDVAAFWKFLEQTALSLAAKPAFAGMTAERLGALLVGRWPSGAPIMRAADNDDPALASNDIASNQFGFAAAAPLARLVNEPPPLDPFPAAPADREGFRCPYAAHIRKVNPRDDVTELGGGNRTLLRRILRRGIPFGPPHEGARTSDDGAERGLMFVSYQADIANQFEFLSTDWIDSAVNPRAYDTHDAGPDPLIGQITDDQGRRTRRMAVPGRDGALEEIVLPTDFVAATGGAYLFSPSVSALHDVLS